LAFRLKHDGFRSLAYLENGRCRLVSRRRNTYKSFEVLRSALEGLKAQSAILDGEIVALDSSGVSQFKELLCYRIANVYQPSKVTVIEPRSSSYGAGL
jgi:bifunctional non-homologous end joining protein LigD